MASSIPKGYTMPDGANLPTPQNGNAKVHQFDPDASPQQKAAAAGQGRDELKAVNGVPIQRFEGKGVYIALAALVR